MYKRQRPDRHFSVNKYSEYFYLFVKYLEIYIGNSNITETVFLFRVTQRTPKLYEATEFGLNVLYSILPALKFGHFFVFVICLWKKILIIRGRKKLCKQALNTKWVLSSVSVLLLQVTTTPISFFAHALHCFMLKMCSVFGLYNQLA